MTAQPAYFEHIRKKAAERWEQLESDPDLAAPWHQLFKQVQTPRHVVSELLQNADDVGATEASVDLQSGEFVFAHDGEDFVKDHFASLCRFGYSNKRLLRTIGFRGVGFKSTFSLGDEVRLATPTLSVAFKSRRFTEPIWVNRAASVSKRTEVRVAVKDEHRQRELERNLEEWRTSPTSLLFFRHICRLRVGKKELHWEAPEPGPLANSEWMALSTAPEEKYLLGAHCDVFTQMRRAYAQSDSERQQAEEEGLVLRDRIKSSYPFHPDLIDIMRERWAAIPDFQRTRGALRFLASCLRSAHRAGHSRMLLGPGDVPIQEGEVRLAFFKEVGQREDFQPCLEHDFVGANARTRRIDDRRARETTSEAGKRPATRLATTMLSSFGGLRRSGGGDGDLLPPGISEADLLRNCVGPDLDSTTVQACLKELKESCLYLHFDGARYCFKKDPNVTLRSVHGAENRGYKFP